MSGRIWSWMLCGACCWTAAAMPAAALSLVELERSVAVATFVDADGLTSDQDSDGESTDQPGSFIEAAASSRGFGDITNAIAEAVQDSSVVLADDGLSADGGGSVQVGVDVMDPGFPSRALGTAETVTRIVFDVTETSRFVLGTALLADLSNLTIFSGSGPVSADVFASARLEGAVSGVVFSLEAIDSAADGAEVSRALDRSGSLQPDSYELVLEARVELLGVEDVAGSGEAGFGFAFQVVPEPDAPLLLALAALLGSGSRCRTSRAGPWA
ncbi:MAG: hypothetical protein QNK05_12830 [Myxococcota bacterium]|nr:hypothetical protein [Myxococcota bacterium]